MQLYVCTYVAKFMYEHKRFVNKKIGRFIRIFGVDVLRMCLTDAFFFGSIAGLIGYLLPLFFVFVIFFLKNF